MGTLVMGKLEAGRVQKGDTILMMPNRASVEVMQVWADEEEVRSNSEYDFDLKFDFVAVCDFIA